MDRTQFFDHLDTLALEGRPVPCRGTQYADWTADDHAAQQRAADGCLSCPAYFDCDTYIKTNPERSGVYAGRTARERGEKP